jgi:ABC-type phosphate transport system substrate-binding protein
MLRNQLAPMALLAAVLSLTLVGNGCNSSSNAEPTSTLTNVIGGVGSTFVDPLMKRWVLGFQQTHPQLGVNYRAEGSGAGIAEIEKSLTEFAASDAPLGDDDSSQCPPCCKCL